MLFAARHAVAWRRLCDDTPDEIRSANIIGSRPEIDAAAGFVNVRTAERIVEATRADWVGWKPKVEVPRNITVPTRK